MKTKRILHVLSRHTRSSSKNMALLILAVSLCNAVSAAVVDSFNADKNPDAEPWGVSEVGWIYTAGSGYNLTGVRTKFGNGPDRRFLVVCMDEQPVQLIDQSRKRLARQKRIER